MGRLSLLALACVSACAGTLPEHTLRHANRMLLGGTVIAMACDWGSTHRIASQGWPHGQYEQNPVLGLRPSGAWVSVYMAAVMAGTVVLGVTLPEKWRTVFLGSVFALEAGYSLNTDTVDGICGIPTNPIVSAR